jgi:sugar O-acyltransferase (sialic acid O-acetyltransferase NeuD family)
MNKLYCIYGASGHSKVIVEILEKLGCIIKGLYDDDAKKKSLCDYPVTNQISMLELQNVNWIIGIGNNIIRKKIVDRNPLNFGMAIDKSSNISKRTQVGKGSVIMAGVSINSSVKIGEHAIINTNSSIDHDCILEDYIHVSPNATLCGGVQVGKGTHIGAGAVIIPEIKIGNWANIGAGTVIIKDVPDYATVVGNPGRLIKQM